MNATHPAGHSPYKCVGGDAGIRKLVDHFCTLMDELPEAYAARKIHPADLTESANKLFDFLSGWLGGPHATSRSTTTPSCGDGTQSCEHAPCSSLRSDINEAPLGNKPIEHLDVFDWKYPFHGARASS
ncbi:hypothetical protein [Hydrogenophaga sp. 70-12]|uniref:globin domain-containing protein n=1 Tax=Hydrogenophaga sp. 70-12 TaxID=1895769 RepID=UPI000A731498|nr:hypothetical protein [Hydrogenophaga sp. 70-12]